VRGGIEAPAGGRVIIVAHAGTIRAALALALELPPERALRFVIDPPSLTRLDRLDNAWRVVAVNRG
jgi:alpha-ribazole phosphatase